MRSSLHLQLGLLLLFTMSLEVEAQENHSLDSLLDSWHEAAARADFDAFFSVLGEESIYIGTDATERWTRSEFIKYAKPYFDAGKAWSFKPSDRKLIISESGSFAWFSELLETQMGPCRGSGILTKNQSGWKIMQYHLALTVPNDLVSKFKKMVEAYQTRQR